MDEAPASAPIPEFKDRTTALMIFGVLEILLGCLSALMVPFMLLVQGAVQQAAGGQANAAAVAPAAIIYGLGAVVFIWLGIGSIKVQRWARALWLVIGWCWLITGVISMGCMVVFLPRMLAAPQPGGQPLPPGAAAMAMAVMLPFMSCFYIILPGALVLFYRSPNVKAT
ncbi:MAG: hypothetical protein NTW87_06360 [Planctomycetota bacterium]|nr:hypothetical protein [Planctomycetota bacterium]